MSTKSTTSKSPMKMKSSCYGSATEALLNLDPILLGYDISRLLHEEGGKCSSGGGGGAVGEVIDQLLEHLEDCKLEILRVVEASRQRKRHHHPIHYHNEEGIGGIGNERSSHNNLFRRSISGSYDSKKGRTATTTMALAVTSSTCPTTTTTSVGHCSSTSTNNNTSNHHHTNTNLIIPSEVLRQIAQSNFLTVSELGRLLLLVSKSFIEILGHDAVWEIICCQQWKNTLKIPRYVIEARGYQWLFHQRVIGGGSGSGNGGGGGRRRHNNNNNGNGRNSSFVQRGGPGGGLGQRFSSTGRPARFMSSSSPFSSSSSVGGGGGGRRGQHGLAAPTLSPDRLVLLTSIWNGTKEVASLAFTGDPLATLVATGELTVRLENPIPLGEFPMVNGIIDFKTSDTKVLGGELFDNWKATIHCVRLDEYKCCSVHETATCAWGEYDYIVDPSSSSNHTNTTSTFQENGNHAIPPTENSSSTLNGTNQDGNHDSSDSVEVDMGYLDFSPPTDGMEFTGLGRALLSRIREFDTHTEKLIGIRLDATLLCFTDGFRQDAKSVKLSFSELRLEVWKSYDNGSAVLFHSTGGESLKHGVTLLHLFDQLLGFQQPT